MSTLDAHASRIVASIDATTRARVAMDPRSAITDCWGIEVEEMAPLESRGDQGHCDGMSFLKGNVLRFRPSRGRRQNFTVAHELAHFLVYEDEEALEWLLSQSETGKLTESICDAIASRLLIPDEILTAAGSTPSGLVFVDLRERTIASDNACAIRLAGRLPCAGFVAVIDVNDHAVACASRRDGTRPYAWKGNPLPDGHPLTRVGDGQTIAVESWWPFPDGTRSTYYLNACREGERIYAVFAEEDLWRVTTFHPTREVHDERRPEQSLRCPCGYRGTFHAYPCGDCGKPHCPRCGRCDCTRRAERDRRCAGCTLMFAPQLLDDAGYCEECR